MSQEGDTTVTADLKNKTLSITGKKTAEIIAILSTIATLWIGWVLYTHNNEAKAGIDRLQDGIERMVQTQTLSACLQGFSDDKREAKVSWCKELAGTSNPRNR